MSVQDYIPLFPNEWIPTVLDMVLDAASTLKKQNPCELENHLSTRLVKRLQMDPRMRRCPFSVFPEYPILDPEIDDSNHKGRIDICFLSPGIGQTYFAIEAKRLHVNFASGWKSQISDYVTSDQGMMCFVTMKYSSAQHAGAMLGYVFDGKLSKAREGLSKAIADNLEILNIQGEEGLIKSDILSHRKRIDETRHQLHGHPFMIYHLLVPV